MKFKHLLIALLVFVLGSCSKEDITTETPTLSENSGVKFTYGNNLPANIEEGTLIIKFRSDVADEIAQTMGTSSNGQPVTAFAPMNTAFSNIQAKSMERLFYEFPRFRERERAAGMHQWYVVRFDQSLNVAQAMHNFNLPDYIEVVEPNIIIEQPEYKLVPEAVFTPMEYVQFADGVENKNDGGATVFNDPLTYRQWHYNNTGGILASQPHSDANLLGAWEVTKGRPEVIVCIVDGGIETSHPDLQANLWVNEIADSPFKAGKHGWNFYNEVSIISPSNHGTHVAGTVAAVNNNNIGVCGIAGGDGTANSGARLMTAQIFPPSGSSSTLLPMVNAIKFGADHGAVISQNSWGGSPGVAMPDNLKAAIDYFVQNAGTDENGNQTGPMKGGLFVVAAGNSDTSRPVYPAMHPQSVNVASITPRFTRSSFSNYASNVTIAAPGGVRSRPLETIIEPGGGDVYSHVYSTILLSDTEYGKDGYGHMSGTSMACPHVSGVSALIISQKVQEGKTQGLTPDDVKETLYSTARNIDIFNAVTYRGQLGAGLVDATKALTGNITYETSPVDPVTDLQADWLRAWVTLEWSITGDKNGKPALAYELIISKNDLRGIDFNNPPANIIKLERINTSTSDKIGKKMSTVFSGLATDQQYWVAISGISVSGVYSKPVIISRIPVEGENPDPATDFAATNWSSTSVSLEWSVTQKASSYIIIANTSPIQDKDFGSAPASAIRKEVQVGDKNVGDKLTAELTGLQANTNYYVGIVAVDSDNNKSSKATIQGKTSGTGTAPEIITPIPNINFGNAGDSKTIDLSQHFTSGGGISNLTFNAEVTSGNDVVSVTDVREGQLTIKALKTGSATILITATNTGGQSVSTSVNVTVGGDVNITTSAKLYPNPVVKDLTIDLSSSQTVQFSLVNAMGAIVLKQTVNVNTPKGDRFTGTVDLSKASGGAYTAVVKMANGQEYTQRITKR